MSSPPNSWNAFTKANRHLVKHLPFGEQSKALSRMYQAQKAQSSNLQTTQRQPVYTRTPPKARPLPQKYQYEKDAEGIAVRADSASACPPLQRDDCLRHKACEWIAGSGKQRQHCRRRSGGLKLKSRLPSTTPLPKWVLDLYGDEKKQQQQQPQISPRKPAPRKAATAAPLPNLPILFVKMVRGDLGDQVGELADDLWQQILQMPQSARYITGYLNRLVIDARDEGLPATSLMASLWNEVRGEFWTNVGLSELEDTDFQEHKYEM